MTSQSNWIFDKKELDMLYKKIKRKDEQSNRELFIAKIFSKYIKGDYINLHKYNCYQLVQYLTTISDQHFDKEFQIRKEKDIKKLIICIGSDQLKTLPDLKMKVQINKHIQSAQIQVKFDNDFEIDDISNDVILNLFDNIKNRNLTLDGSQYIIARRVSDNKILKSQITTCNHDEIEEIIENCQDGELYDLAIVSSAKFEAIQNIKLRYLNYISNNDDVKLTLQYPESLVTSSLYKVKLTNISECINLCNFASWVNTYTKQDLESLQNIKTIISCADQYETEEGCMLQDLFKNNKLEYIYVKRGKKDSKIVRDMQLSSNIENLVFLYCKQENELLDIKLDVSTHFPQNLRLFQVSSEYANNTQYGILVGAEEDQQKVKDALVHQLNQSQRKSGDITDAIVDQLYQKLLLSALLKGLV